jgi:hypothetical protein
MNEGKLGLRHATGTVIPPTIRLRQVCSPIEEGGNNVRTIFLGDLRYDTGFLHGYAPAAIVMMGNKRLNYYLCSKCEFLKNRSF